ncbi:TIGR02678 family protein [Ralstonia pseudosolanacearum]|uniref:TIGR02678 family protein n=1 Tax=Ralstonia pseudosolanacearum TaxID=1310165 RepID=UPI000DAF1A97|nr:TIGR02678 family protein [Ralstonia pseudosolanacearum]AZU58737.1 TIGR02678 family protein [Ralstonia solanacearum]MCK4138487.1 TIGR02678 family protein [Ralstonia pseudosolanacearum]RAA09291.1 TIGR02678 family protein [Ralstonia pseudosolanacearum]UQY84584.1 TIGR02678 family protein [Ralstonia pseudosolanacearum]
MSNDSHDIGRQQARHRDDERTQALRALLMTPLMTPAHESFAAVRRHADELRAWFARETGWTLHIERDCARLYKRPADLQDASRGLPGYERRRYVLLCLACAVLERADPQITLRVLGDRLLALAADPALASRNFHFTLGAAHERRELVAVCRSLVELGVLQRIAGDEESFVRSTGDAADSGDALYDVHRRVLAGLLAAVRGPSTWPAEQTPVSLDERLASLVAEHMPDSDDGLRTALRHDLARRLLDNPVVYLNTLDAELRAYFVNQRGAMATRLCDATGLVAEQRAEGLALVDEDGELTDVAMPAEGTEAHATLLVAEFLAGRSRADAQAPTTLDEITAFLADARTRYGSYWRKSAREPGAERELTTVALERLLKLQLVARMADRIQPLPALARFALGETDIRAPIRSATQSNLFE